MKEVLFRIFEANPNKQNVVIQYTQTQYEHEFMICSKSNGRIYHSFDFSNFQTLKDNEQIAIINTLNSVLDWYNLQA
jgi:hypothetical protein